MRHVSPPLLLILAAAVAHAHGINAHVHVTGWAIENLPPGELSDFFADHEVRAAAQIGAAFPDSGYAVGDEYGELSHWEPYVNAHVQYLREVAPPPYESLEVKKRVAFLMGLASHGMEDEIFDSIFLAYVQEHDGSGQDDADPGTDAFLFADGYLRFKPPLYAPYDDLIAVFERAFGHAVDEDTLHTGLYQVQFLMIEKFDAIAPILDREHRPHLTWTADHYMDFAVPGSIASEITPTGAYLQALWERLHGRFPAAALPVYTFPAAPRRLRENAHARVESWVTVVFGEGVYRGSLTAENVELLGPDGGPIPFDLAYTRWSSGPEDVTRVAQIRPAVDLAPDAEHTVRLGPGVRLVDGETLDSSWSFSFRTACEPEGACEEGGAVPHLDAGPPPEDAGPADGAPPADATAAQRDAGAPESPDAAPPDAAPLDAARAFVPDGEASRLDAAPQAAAGGGSGGCHAGRSRASPGVIFALAPLLFLTLALRRRPR